MPRGAGALTAVIQSVLFRLGYVDRVAKAESLGGHLKDDNHSESESINPLLNKSSDMCGETCADSSHQRLSTSPKEREGS